MQDAMWRRMGQLGYGGTPPIVPQGRTPNFAPDLPSGVAASPRRRMGGADNGTVALALSGVSLYWTLPALLSMQGNRRRRRARRRSS